MTRRLPERSVKSWQSGTEAATPVYLYLWMHKHSSNLQGFSILLLVITRLSWTVRLPHVCILLMRSHVPSPAKSYPDFNSVAEKALAVFQPIRRLEQHDKMKMCEPNVPQIIYPKGQAS
jgi:hypothetical protein